MKFNDFLTEEQLDELSFSQLGAGIKGAVSGYKASGSERQGREHAKKIAARLKHEFMRLVGGGQPATKDNLHNFLSSYGLNIDDTVPETPPTPQAPAQSAAATPAQPSNVKEPPVRVEPTLDPETPPASNVPSAPSSTPSSSGGTITPTAKGLVHKANPNNPNLRVAEDTTTLSNAQVDQIIDKVVSKNYSRIVAAQRGINVDGGADAVAPQPTQTAPAQAEPGPAGNPFSDPNKLIQAWMDYIRAGGDINSKITKLSAMLVRAIKQQGSQLNQKKQAQTPPVQPAAAPTKPAVDLSHPADDNPNIGLGSNEGYSKFLGRRL